MGMEKEFIMEKYKEIATKELADYISTTTSCAAALTKQWMTGSLTEAESTIFCKKWMKKNKPNCTWGSKPSHIKAHRNWLFGKWLYTETNDKGKIVVKTDI